MRAGSEVDIAVQYQDREATLSIKCKGIHTHIYIYMYTHTNMDDAHSIALGTVVNVQT